MNAKRITIAVGTLGVALAATWFVVQSRTSATPTYRFATVDMGSVQQSVSATGALSAVKTVQVGTQVSGQVAEIHADFNGHVNKGQLLARIDPTLQKQAVQDAEAQLAKAQAQYNQAKQEFDRNSPLIAQGIITASEFSTVQLNLAVAQAGVKSAQVTLDRARQNLSYTNIYAPISGVVVERTVDVGQTVAASLSAPQLFLLAQDLSKLQILAAVDESDIAAIKDSQPVQFTVQSYPGRKFVGQVAQVRLQSKLTDNVVNYTVVVTLDNADGKLMPGMTATVEFITGSAANVLTVPNLALRYKPSAEQLAASGIAATDTSRRRGRGGAGDSAGSGGANNGGANNGGANSGGGNSGNAGGNATAGGDNGARGAQTNTAQTGGRAGGGGGGGAPGAAGARPRRTTFGGVGGPGTLYAINSTTGKLRAIRVRVGLSDGQRTQVTGDSLVVGMQVIVGAATSTSPATTAPSTNPLTPQGRGGRGGP